VSLKGMGWLKRRPGLEAEDAEMRQLDSRALIVTVTLEADKSETCA
jgi:hypothetical protein